MVNDMMKITKEMVEMIKCNSCGGTTVFISGSIVKCEYCGRLYSTSNGELSLADPERLYSSAVNMSKSQNEETLKVAIETFEALGSYKDSSAMADSCRGMIAQSRVQAEERRLAAERQAELEKIESEKKAFEEKKKTKIKRMVIAIVSAVAVIAVVIGVISNSNKLSSYNKAMELYSMGQYEEARAAFNDLGDYSDAATYVSTIDNFLIERQGKYEKGISYYEKGAYSECIISLVDISDYLDSADYIEKSVDGIYQQATEFYDAGEFEQAKELLGKIPNGSTKDMDVELLLADIEEIIIEQTNAANYEQAKGYYDSGDYEMAQRLFTSLGNYGDSTTYLTSIGNIYYNQANSLYKQGEYVQCGDLLTHIDTMEEWREYALAQDLFTQAKDSYQSIVAKNAKAISRNEDNSAMSTYIDGMVCNLLSTDEANALKENCYVNKVALSTIEPYVGELSAYSQESYRTDTLGNVYSYTLLGASPESRGEQSATYYINNQYTVFGATVAVKKKDSIGENQYGTIRLYGDGRLLWSDEEIKATTKPYSIEVDVSGVTDLKIEMYATGNMGDSGIHILLCDPILYE